MIASIAFLCLIGSNYGFQEDQRSGFNLDVKSKIKNIINIGSDILENDDFFGSINDVHLDDNNNIYLMDAKERFIAEYDLKGKLICKITLPKGEGPGEYSRPNSFCFDGRRFVIADFSLMRVTLLDRNGKYLDSFHLDEQPGKIELHENRLYLTSSFDYSEKRVHVYDVITKKKILSFVSANSMTNEVANFGEIDHIKILNDRLYFSSFFPYEISIYSLNGNLEKKFTHDNPEYNKKMERDKMTKALRFVIGSSAILVSGNKIINVLKGRNIEKKSIYSVFDIFKESGEHVMSISSSEFGVKSIRFADINKNGYLAVDCLEPYPQIRVFFIKDLLN